MARHRRPPLPHWGSPRGHCRWCGEVILHEAGKRAGEPNTRRHWHPACLDAYLVATSSQYMRRAVSKRDRGVCAECAADCRHEGDWDADHIVPLWSLDRSLPHDDLLHYWSLDNLQTLCRQHHVKKCAREAAERAALRRAA